MLGNRSISVNVVPSATPVRNSGMSPRPSGRFTHRQTSPTTSPTTSPLSTNSNIQQQRSPPPEQEQQQQEILDFNAPEKEENIVYGRQGQLMGATLGQLVGKLLLPDYGEGVYIFHFVILSNHVTFGQMFTISCSHTNQYWSQKLCCGHLLANITLD